MLRGQFAAARARFRKAFARDPHNPTIANNLHMLQARQRTPVAVAAR